MIQTTLSMFVSVMDCIPLPNDVSDQGYFIGLRTEDPMLYSLDIFFVPLVYQQTLFVLTNSQTL